MSGHHSHAPARHDWNHAFALGVALNVGFVAIEAAFGVIAGSLALIADAGHNLGDVLGLLLAWGAAALAARKPTERRTYGFRRATILASIVSAVLLLVALGGIAWEAIGRLGSGQAHHLDGRTIIVVATIGVIVNSITAALFVSGRESDLNIRGAFLHMAADAAISLGVVIAGLVIVGTGWIWIDPVLSLVIAAIIFASTWSLLRESTGLVFDVVPRSIDPARVREYLLSLPGVCEVHDLHIWAMSTTEIALTVHLVMPEGSEQDAFLHRISHDLRENFGIAHPTIQIERGDGESGCHQAADDVI